MRPSHPSLLSPLPLIYTATRSGIRRREIYKNRNIILTYFESCVKILENVTVDFEFLAYYSTIKLFTKSLSISNMFLAQPLHLQLPLCLPVFLSVFLMIRLSISFFVHFVLVFNNVQGPHDKSAQKEFLSHTLKNKVFFFIFLVFHDNNI